MNSQREKIAAFLRDRDECVLPEEATDQERLASAEAILAMLSSSPKGMEPVAWRYRLKGPNTGWVVLHEEPEFILQTRDAFEVQPLYVSPVEGRASRDHDYSATARRFAPALLAALLVTGCDLPGPALTPAGYLDLKNGVSVQYYSERVTGCGYYARTDDGILRPQLRPDGSHIGCRKGSGDGASSRPTVTSDAVPGMNPSQPLPEPPK